MNFEQALRYWNLGIQYLHLTQHACDEIVKQGNAWVVAGDPDLTDADYFERTKWSDHKIAVPLLFNFYHGIELMLKGFGALNSATPTKASHKLTSLAAGFNADFTSPPVSAFLKKYLEPDALPGPLKRFLTESSIDIDQYYQALKYPESTGGAGYVHGSLYYKGSWGVPFYTELRDDIAAARREFVMLGRSFAPS